MSSSSGSTYNPEELLKSLPEGLKVPPPPTQPSWGNPKLGIGLIRKPENPQEKFMQGCLWSALYGLAAGTATSWFYDYKKVTRTEFWEAIQLHKKIVTKPFVYVTTLGVTYSAMNAYWDVHNSGGFNRIEKEQTVQQKTISGIVTGSVLGLFSRTMPGVVLGAVGIGFLAWAQAFYAQEFYPADKERRRRLVEERIVPSHEPRPEWLDEKNLNADRMIYTFFFEEQRKTKKNENTIKFEEE
ncbi:hypothetical protein ABK040_016258 [Willaertia magna]